MSIDYAAGLSHCDDLGVCGLDEIFDHPDIVLGKVTQLADLLRQYKGSCVVHAGAGLSTPAGIRDFRGKKGVWTEMLRNDEQCHKLDDTKPTKKESNDQEPRVSQSVRPFDDTQPTLAHMALRRFCELGFIRHIISQNVDGLFLKSNLDRDSISELHGNFYLDECTKCRSRFIRNSASTTMRLTKSSVKCPRNGYDPPVSCKGHLRDTILDWDSPIPYNELRVAQRESKRCKLHICIGTSMQLRPSKDLVCKPGKLNNKLVVINLQPTHLDKHADLVIHYYADDVMRELAKTLEIVIPGYEPKEDPTKEPARVGTRWLKKSAL